MLALDWVFLGVMLASVLVGAWRGLVVELLSLANWFLAFLVARWFAPDVAPHLPMGGASEVLRYAAAFVVVFISAVFVGSIVIWLVGKLFQAAGLRPADRALGALFGLVRGVAVLVAAAVLVAMTPMHTEPWWRDSKGAAWAGALAKGLKPVLPPEFGKYLP